MNTFRRNFLLTPTTKMLALLVVLAATFALLTPAPAAACEEEWWQTFYCEPERINVCGECYRPCYGWASCSGCRTDYYSFVSYSCGPCVP